MGTAQEERKKNKGEKRIAIAKNKAVAMFASLMMLTIAIKLVALPAANAQEITMASYVYIGATPNPVWC
jgi:hypothetical protein